MLTILCRDRDRSVGGQCSKERERDGDGTVTGRRRNGDGTVTAQNSYHHCMREKLRDFLCTLH